MTSFHKTEDFPPVGHLIFFVKRSLESLEICPHAPQENAGRQGLIVFQTVFDQFRPVTAAFTDSRIEDMSFPGGEIFSGFRHPSQHNAVFFDVQGLDFADVGRVRQIRENDLRDSERQTRASGEERHRDTCGSHGEPGEMPSFFHVGFRILWLQHIRVPFKRQQLFEENSLAAKHGIDYTGTMNVLEASLGKIPVALTVAGSDPSGGAGLQADLKTFHQFGVYGMAVVALLTVQNTRGLRRTESVSPDFLDAQLQAVLDDISPHAVKSGALGSCENIEAFALRMKDFRGPLVVDPVMFSKNGERLMAPEAPAALKRYLLPLARLVTPNIEEAEALSGIRCRDRACVADMAKAISDFGPSAVLIKGGHLEGEATDFFYAGGTMTLFTAPRILTGHTHGTGCTLSAAIAAELAKGRSIVEAVDAAKSFITRAIKTAPGIGKGRGPVNHHAPV